MADEPTIGEVYRLLMSMDKRLDQVVTTAVFRAEQDNNRERFEVLAKNQTDWRTESRGEHVRLDGRLDAVEAEYDGKLDAIKVEVSSVEKTLKAEIKAERERSDALERKDRERRTQTWIAIGLAALGTLMSFGSAILLRSIGG